MFRLTFMVLLSINLNAGLAEALSDASKSEEDFSKAVQENIKAFSIEQRNSANNIIMNKENQDNVQKLKDTVISM